VKDDGKKWSIGKPIYSQKALYLHKFRKHDYDVHSKILRKIVVEHFTAVKIFTDINWPMEQPAFDFSYKIEGTTEKVYNFHTQVS
jgi:hypothetical protein